MKQTTYGTFPIVWNQHRDELYASVGQVRLRITTEPAVEAISQEPTYSSSLAVLTASGWAVVKRVAHLEEKSATRLSEDAADMLYGLPASCDDPWVRLDEESSLYARLDGRFLVEMKCNHYFIRAHGVSLFVFSEENKWQFVHHIEPDLQHGTSDLNARQAGFAKATEKMKQFAAIVFLNRLTSPV